MGPFLLPRAGDLRVTLDPAQSAPDQHHLLLERAYLARSCLATLTTDELEQLRGAIEGYLARCRAREEREAEERVPHWAR